MQIADLGRGIDFIGRLLEDHGQRHHGIPGGPGEQQPAGAHPVLGAPLHDFLHGIGLRGGLPDLDLQPRLPVIALLDGRIVARKLEGMCPLQLKGHRLQRPGRCRGQPDHRNPQATPPQKPMLPACTHGRRSIPSSVQPPPTENG